MIPLPHPDDALVSVRDAVRLYRDARAAERVAFRALSDALAAALEEEEPETPAPDEPYPGPDGL